MAGWCEAHYIDLLPHNPLGPVSTGREEFILKVMGLTPKLMEFILKLMGLTPKLMEFTLKVMGLTPKLMEFTLKVMGLTPQLMEFTLQLMDFTPKQRHACTSGSRCVFTLKYGRFHPKYDDLILNVTSFY